MEMIKEWWESFVMTGKPSQRLKLKLKLLREKLRCWNKEVFGNIEEKRKTLLAEIKYWDEKEE